MRTPAAHNDRAALVADEPARYAARGCNPFGLRLLRALLRDDECANLVLSPPSLAFALLLVQSGAAGRTQGEIAAALGLAGAPRNELDTLASALHAALTAPQPGVRRPLANALWVDAGLPLAESFQARAKRFHRAHASNLAFSDPRAVAEINAWVTEHTDGMVESLVTSADLARPTDCIVTNAMCFKARWKTRFEPELTHEAPFTLASGQRNIVPFMVQSGRFAYFEHDAFQALSLPYASGQISMDLVLPAIGRSLAGVLADLEAFEWGDWTTHVEKATVKVIMPRCVLSYAREMRTPLAALGVRTAFEPGADFSPMGLGGRFLGKIRHAARVDIHEEGTQAGAATGATLIRALSRTLCMRMDRPFFCAIRDGRSGCLLFAACVLTID